MDLIEIETMEAGSEEDDLPGHPDEHDDKTCEIKKCRACKLKRGWRTWCKAAASPSPFDQKIFKNMEAQALGAGMQLVLSSDDGHCLVRFKVGSVQD